MESTTKPKPSRTFTIVAYSLMGIIVLALPYLIFTYPKQFLLIPLIVVGACLFVYIIIRIIIMLIKDLITFFF